MSNPRRRSQRAKSVKSEETIPDGVSSSFDWRDFLKANPDTKGVPVWRFEHVPLVKELRQLMTQEDLKIQVKLKEEDYPEIPYVQEKEVYWIATPRSHFGLMAKVEYELVEEDENREELFMRYVNFLLEAKSLENPIFRMDTTITCYPKSFRWIWDLAAEVEEKANWPKYIGVILHNWRNHSIPNTLTTAGELNWKYESRYTIGQLVETLDKSCISQMRVAEVIKLVGGRVHVRYWDSTAKPGEADFVCHERSQTIFPSGWSQTVGHDLSAPSGYPSPILTDDIMKTLINYNQMPLRNVREGMWLEIVDPLNPSQIAAAQISKVLRYGYILVTIDGRQFSTTKCYHITSLQLLYCGFCKTFGLPLIKPISYNGIANKFSWKKFLNKINGTELVIREYHWEDETDYGVVKDMKLEAVDLMEPSHVCVATVSDVKGRMLRVSFDGWEERYDQWMVIDSEDLFPMGWCEANDYPLRAPRIA